MSQPSPATSFAWVQCGGLAEEKGRPDLWYSEGLWARPLLRPGLGLSATAIRPWGGLRRAREIGPQGTDLQILDACRVAVCPAAACRCCDGFRRSGRLGACVPVSDQAKSRRLLADCLPERDSAPRFVDAEILSC